MRFDRYDPLSRQFVEPPERYRNDRLREQVDSLPKRQRHMVSRVFFGGAYVKDAAAEIKLDPARGRFYLEKGLERLRAMQEAD